MRLLPVALALLATPAPIATGHHLEDEVPTRLFVDARKGRDKQAGTERKPMRSLSSAISRLPDVVPHSVTIEVLGGDEYASTGGVGMPDESLVLMRRMPPGVTVQIVGRRDKEGQLPILAWEGADMVSACEGRWRLENLQLGSFSKRQRRGVAVSGTADVTLKDMVFRTRSLSDAAIHVSRGGFVGLRGTIGINEHLHDEEVEESFAGIIATSGGMVKFLEREGATLDMGNGSLSSSYYGSIRLGCETARITSWGRQSNNLAVNNGGRVDLHGTTVTLVAQVPENTPVGPEHDGHILGEDAHLILSGKNRNAIVLQKASTFTCNDVELRGEFTNSLVAMSGSMFVGRFLSDVTRVEAHTGATVHLVKVEGELHGPVIARRGGVVSLPDGTLVGPGE